MDQKTVTKLEDRLAEAMVQVIMGMGLKRLPLLPSHHSLHLMAKAAVAVYEAAAENHDRYAGGPPHSGTS